MTLAARDWFWFYPDLDVVIDLVCARRKIDRADLVRPYQGSAKIEIQEARQAVMKIAVARGYNALEVGRALKMKPPAAHHCGRRPVLKDAQQALINFVGRQVDAMAPEEERVAIDVSTYMDDDALEDTWREPDEIERRKAAARERFG